MLKSFVVTPQNGATGRLGRFDFVVGGSTPSFTTRIDVQCENPNNT